MNGETQTASAGRKPRRILMTADAVGGVWTYAMDLCAGLAASDVNILLATMGPEPTLAQREQVAQLPHVRLETSDFRLEWMRDPWDDIDLAGEWLTDLAESWQPDLIHLNGYAHAALPWSVPVLVVAHSCVFSWWHAVQGGEPPAEWRTYHQMVAAGLRHADCVVAPSAAMLASLDVYREQPLRQGQRYEVIHNGRDLPLRYHGRANQPSPLVFSAGRLWDEAKNVRVLDYAARTLIWPVYVAGETVGPSGTETELLYARALGPLAAGEVQDWLARASIYALPALYEPFGLSALEAALHGCALVLGDIPSLREIWGDAAIFVPPRDADALAVALSSLINDPVRLQQYSRRAYARAQAYPRSCMADAYLSLYRELCSTPGDQIPSSAQTFVKQAHP
jgi:glycogen(starch) synthase